MSFTNNLYNNFKKHTKRLYKYLEHVLRVKVNTRIKNILFFIKKGDKMLKIREIREDKDLTKKELGKLLNCTQQTYARYESGEITIDIFNLIKLANYYNTSTDYLLGLTNETKPYPRIK